MVCGGAIFSLLRCDTITILAKILVYLLYYVVTLLPALLLFSLLYYRHCFNFLSCYGFKFRAWIIFFGHSLRRF